MSIIKELMDGVQCVRKYSKLVIVSNSSHAYNTRPSCNAFDFYLGENVCSYRCEDPLTRWTSFKMSPASAGVDLPPASQSKLLSRALAIRSTFFSSQSPPTICRPTGSMTDSSSTACDHPIGSDSAGWPVTLKMAVLLV